MCTSTKYDDLKYGTTIVSEAYTTEVITGYKTKIHYYKRINKGDSWEDGYDYFELTEDEFKQAQQQAGSSEDNFFLDSIYYYKSEEEEPIYTECYHPAVVNTDYKSNIWTRGEYKYL